jgi:hypothetical protein
MVKDTGMVPHLHTATNLRVNPYPTLRTSTEATVHLSLLHRTTPASHPIGLQTDTNQDTPFPPSPKKARRKWQTGQERCRGHQCLVLPEPRSVHTHLRRSRVSWDITLHRGAVWVSILQRLSLDRWGNSRSPSLNRRLSSSRTNSNNRG